jgi:glycine/D-amino acid oxidase-like deaminating enzyme
MRVAVLGAGLQGTCVAMELASLGVEVDLFDKNDLCLTQASAQNEGKIHLGYVYANDRSRRTARKMIEGALSFAPLMRRWIGDAVDTVPISTPFYYAVHRDSLLTVDDVKEHLAFCHATALENRSRREADYFGMDAVEPPALLSDSECASMFDTERVSAAFRTPEIAIDPQTLAQAVRERIKTESKIRCRLRTFVHGANPTNDGVVIESQNGGEQMTERYDHAINCLWEGRLRVDQTAGVKPPRPWLYRLKFNLRLRSCRDSAKVPSVTIVLGPFGDVVGYDSRNFYLSWYPVGMRGTSADLIPPDWNVPTEPHDLTEIQSGIVAGLAGIVPAVAQLNSDNVESCSVRPGIIFAWGERDIDDISSRLHERFMIGPESHGRYHTIDTGKLTTAPLFAKEMADRVMQIG